MQKNHQELMRVWSQQAHHQGKCFITDGIIDPIRWSAAPFKVLFLLKEAYDSPDATDGWDLCEVIREEWGGPKYKVWWMIAYWGYAIHNSQNGIIPQFPNETDSYSLASEALLASAVVNVKKSGGKSISDGEDISAYAQRDGHFIKTQVDLIGPQIVICGNVWGSVSHLWPNAIPIYDMVWKAENVFFVDFWHPANQFPNLLNYYTLGCLLQNAKVLELILNDSQVLGVRKNESS